MYLFAPRSYSNPIYQNMTVKNGQLLQSQQALQEIAQANLKGVYALQVRDILGPVQKRLDRLQEVQQDLMEREDMSEQEADEEWRQVLQEKTNIDEDPLPRQALEDIEISAGTLIALDWMIGE